MTLLLPWLLEQFLGSRQPTSGVFFFFVLLLFLDIRFISLFFFLTLILLLFYLIVILTTNLFGEVEELPGRWLVAIQILKNRLSYRTLRNVNPHM